MALPPSHPLPSSPRLDKRPPLEGQLLPLADADDRPNRRASVPEAEAFARVERLAKLMDEAFTVPGTGIKLGLDAVIGLVPGIGDAAGLAIGSYLVLEAHRLGAPAELKMKMARNVAIDTVAGFVPVLGDVVDVAYRSNRRNLELLRKHFRPLDVRAPEPCRQQWLGWAVRWALAAGVAVLVWWLWSRGG